MIAYLDINVTGAEPVSYLAAVAYISLPGVSSERNLQGSGSHMREVGFSGLSGDLRFYLCNRLPELDILHKI